VQGFIHRMKDESEWTIPPKGIPSLPYLSKGSYAN